MSKKIVTYIILTIYTVLILSCTKKKTELPIAKTDYSNSFTIIADTIINDVLIKNPDNDEWKDHCLRNLDKKALINDIFQLIYQGELIPHEFFTDTVLNIEFIKTLEKSSEFSREQIAKIQFEEAWYFDSEHKKMMKKVISLMMAYEIYDSQDQIKGYKPAFKVYLNND